MKNLTTRRVISANNSGTGVINELKNSSRFLTLNLSDKEQTLKLLGVCACLLLVVASVLLFNACKKDTEKIENNKQQKTGTTQVVDINTVIQIGTVEYPVTGTAIVGNNNGRIYECNVHWIMRVERADGIVEDFTQLLNARLKPNLYNATTHVEPVIGNYIITVTNPNMVNTESIANLWDKIAVICNENAVIVENDADFNEKVRLYMCEALISFNDALRPEYYPAESFDMFCLRLMENPTALTTNGRNLLELSYYCLSHNISDDYIYSHYTGKGMLEAAIFVLEHPNSERDFFGEDIVFMSSDRRPCKWWQLGCHLHNLLDWISETIDKLIEITEKLNKLKTEVLKLVDFDFNPLTPPGND